MTSWILDKSYSFSEGTVRYGVTGTGDDVVLVHGTPWSSFTWHLLIAHLSTRYRVHYYDFIGYGASDKRPGQQVALDVQGNLLSELLAHWKLTSPRVVAHDFGGATALRAHLLHGCDYRQLVMMDVVAMAPWGSPFFAHVQQHEAAFAGVPDYIHRAIVETYIQGALYQDLASEQLRSLVAPWLGNDGKPAFYRQIAQADQRHTDEVESDYANIRCRASILWGENDTWIPLATGLRLHKAIPGSEFVVIPNAGHLVQLENPTLVNHTVSTILSAG